MNLTESHAAAAGSRRADCPPRAPAARPAACAQPCSCCELATWPPSGLRRRSAPFRCHLWRCCLGRDIELISIYSPPTPESVPESLLICSCAESRVCSALRAICACRTITKLPSPPFRPLIRRLRPPPLAATLSRCSLLSRTPLLLARGGLAAPAALLPRVQQLVLSPAYAVSTLQGHPVV